MEIKLSKIPEELTQFSEAKTQIAEIASKCQNVIIADESSLNFAKNLAKDAKRIEGLIESVRKTVTEPFLSQQRAIKRYADNLVSELETSITGLRNNIKDYEVKIENERKVELKRLEDEQKRIEDERKRFEELAKQSEIVDTKAIGEIKKASDEIALQQFEIASKPINNSLQDNWVFELEDLSKVPFAFLCLDEKKVKEAIKNNVRNISGLRIYNDPKLTLAKGKF